MFGQNKTETNYEKNINVLYKKDIVKIIFVFFSNMLNVFISLFCFLCLILLFWIIYKFLCYNFKEQKSTKNMENFEDEKFIVNEEEFINSLKRKIEDKKKKINKAEFLWFLSKNITILKDKNTWIGYHPFVMKDGIFMNKDKNVIIQPKIQLYQEKPINGIYPRLRLNESTKQSEVDPDIHLDENGFRTKNVKILNEQICIEDVCFDENDIKKMNKKF